jgi:hypothetical protein
MIIPIDHNMFVMGRNNFWIFVAKILLSLALKNRHSLLSVLGWLLWFIWLEDSRTEKWRFPKSWGHLPFSSILMLDFPWNKPFILGYPHGYGNHIFFRYINPLQLLQESVSFFLFSDAHAVNNYQARTDIRYFPLAWIHDEIILAVIILAYTHGFFLKLYNVIHSQCSMFLENSLLKWASSVGQYSSTMEQPNSFWFMI